MTPKNIHKIFIPPPPPKKKKIFIFLKTPKNIEIQNFEPQKNSPSLRICENIGVSPCALYQLNCCSLDGSGEIVQMRMPVWAFTVPGRCPHMLNIPNAISWRIGCLQSQILGSEFDVSLWGQFHKQFLSCEHNEKYIDKNKRNFTPHLVPAELSFGGS